MLRNYLKVALRTLRRNKGYTAINVGGLAVGLAACLLIGLWVRHQLSYDDFHEAADRTYRVATYYKLSADHDGETYTKTHRPLAAAMERLFPQVEQTVRVIRAPQTVERGETSFVEENFYRADAGFFEMFSFPLVEGRAGQVLHEPRSLVLTRSAAEKYFPDDETPVGRTLRVEGDVYEVTGVAADLPENTHFGFEMVARLPQSDEASWYGPGSVITYVRLAEGAAPDALQSKLTELIREERPRSVDDPGQDRAKYLQPITGIHLGQGLPPGVELRERGGFGAFRSTGNATHVYLFSALAVFVLLLACVNFMNLATARSTERAKEVGMRKALGARRAQLAGQFLGEAVLMSLGALVVALGLARLALPALNTLAGTSLSLSAVLGGPQALWVVGGALAAGLLAGSYPAFALSGFAPVAVLRGTAHGTGGGRLRRGLVVFQFAAGVALIAGTGVVYQQLDYLLSKDLGFEKEHTVLIEMNDYMVRRGAPDPPKQALLGLPGVKSVTRADAVPGEDFDQSTYSVVGGESDAKATLHATWGDYGYTETLGIAVKKGRDFSRAHPSDSSAALINEAAARALFGQEDPIGKRIVRGIPDSPTRTVIGVVENFNYQSLRREVKPMVIKFLEYPYYWPSPEVVAVRIAPEGVPATLVAIERVWNEAMPGAPFNYSFLDDQLEAQYRATERFGTLFTVFSALAVLIACLGLFGLAAFAAERRRKEIAVRKTFGATTAQLVALLSKDFLKLVAVGFAVATPLAYFAMQRWLEGFAYRVELGPFVFIAAGALALVVALTATGTQALHAARANPADALRDE